MEVGGGGLEKFLSASTSQDLSLLLQIITVFDTAENPVHEMHFRVDYIHVKRERGKKKS